MPPPKVVPWRLIEALWSKDLFTIKGNFYLLCAASFPLKITEVPKWLKQQEIREPHVRSQEVGWFQGYFFHQLKHIFKDWGSFHLSLLQPQLRHMESGLISDHLFYIRVRKEMSFCASNKIHKTHRYFPHPLEAEGGAERLLSEFEEEQINIWQLSGQPVRPNLEQAALSPQLECSRHV